MIIYTASDQSYADSVIGYIDPMKAYFKYRLYRHNCVKIQSESGPLYVKDLRIIKNCPLSNMIIIDNSVLSFAFHLNNGIPILPFYSNKEDVEMDFLKNYLTKLAKYDNLTEQNGATFNLGAVLEDTLKEADDNNDDGTSKSAVNFKNANKSTMKIKESKLDTVKTEKNLIRTKKMENLEVAVDEKKPNRKKSKIQNKIYETLEKAKLGNK